MRISKTLFAVAAMTLAHAAFAGPQCTDRPKSEWMGEEAMKRKIADEGYVVDKFKTTDGNCYEIYGKDKDGKKVEIYFDPLDGHIVKEKRR